MVTETFVNERISRQLDLVNPTILDTPVFIIGCGAIGSWSALALAKMGFKDVTLVDADDYSSVNLASQACSVKQIGKNKAQALADTIKEFTELEYKVINKFWDSNSEVKLCGVVIPAVDTMAARIALYGHLVNNINNVKVIIDPRMAAEEAHIYTINPSNYIDKQTYEKTLFSDDKAYQAPCTAKSTTYCALTLSGLVAQTVSDYLQQKSYLRVMRFSMSNKAFEAQIKKADQNGYTLRGIGA